MEEFLKQLMGKEIDIACGAGATVRGDVVDVKNGVLYIRDDQERVVDRQLLAEDRKAAGHAGRAWTEDVLRSPDGQCRILDDEHHAERRDQL